MVLVSRLKVEGGNKFWCEYAQNNDEQRKGGGNQWPGAPVGARAYVGEFQPKCSKFGTFVHLGSKTSKQNLKEMSFRGPFVQTLEKCEKCNFVIFLYKKFIFT